MTREEAIKELRCFIGQLTEGCQEVIKILIPELAESDDERHWKWILEYLYDGLRKADEQFKDQFKSAIAYLEKQKAKERLDRMAPIYNDKESFESALEKAWKYYNESTSRKVDSFEDDYIECVFSKGFREGFLYKEKQKEQKSIAHENDLVSKPKTSLEILKHYLIWTENSEEDCPYTWKELAAAIKDGITALEQKSAEYLSKRKVYDIMNKLTEFRKETSSLL